MDSDDRSPHQIFPRSTFEPGFSDKDLKDRPEVVAPSYERMPFGGRERGGASAGELHKDGPGPFPSDLFSASDIANLPWKRERGDEWSTVAFRAVVLAFMRNFFREHKGDRLVGWEIVEKATGLRMGPMRLSPNDQYLLFKISKRMSETRIEQVEVAQAFPIVTREGAGLASRLSYVRTSLNTALAAIV